MNITADQFLTSTAIAYTLLMIAAILLAGFVWLTSQKKQHRIKLKT